MGVGYEVNRLPVILGKHARGLASQIYRNSPLGNHCLSPYTTGT